MKEEPASESAAAPVPTASRIWRSRSAWLIAADAAAATAGAIAVTGGDLCGGGEWWQLKTAGGSRWLLGWIGLGVVTPSAFTAKLACYYLGLLGSCAYGP